MPYFKDEQNRIHFLSEKDIENGGVFMLPQNCVPLSKEEAESLLPVAVETDIVVRYTREIQKRLDDFARTRNYDSILSAATYATSTVSKFKVEGQYAVEVRDTTWTKCYEVLAEVESGSRPMPTLEDLIAELPILGWSDA